MSESESSFLKAPFEELNSNFHVTKRRIEKEISFAASHLKTMHRYSSQLNPEQAKIIIKGLLGRLRSLQAELEAAYAREEECLSLLSERVSHLSSGDYEVKKPLRFIAEHFARSGNVEIAKTLSEKAKLRSLVDIDLLQQAQKVAKELGRKDTALALEWCDAHKSKLKKLQSPLEFNLKLQKFVEMVKERNMVGAISYGRSHFSMYPEWQKEVQQAMVLLAVIHKQEHFEQYSWLLEGKRWDFLVSLFMKEVFRVYGMSPESPLEIIIRAGMLALKTPLCIRDECKEKDCPLCQPCFLQMSEGMAVGCRSHTSLICRILGVPMNENNPPLALPNGQAFSEQGIKKLIKNGKIECPVTHAVFNAKEVTKIYGLI